MAQLERFAARIQALLSAASPPPMSPTEAAGYMRDVQQRHQQFTALVEHVLGDIVRPRMEYLARLFPQAAYERRPAPYHLTQWYGYTERFPASTRLDLGLEPDERFEQACLLYDLRIVPVFMKYNRHDRLVMPPGTIDDVHVTSWVEDRLAEFVETYLRLERVDRDQSEILATDPVCGMRVTKSTAAAQLDYLGHPYFFCSAVCRDEFAGNPRQFVTIETL